MSARTPRSCWKDYRVAGKKGLSWGLAGREGLDSSAVQGKNKRNTSVLECSSVAGGFASLTVVSKVYAVNIYKDYRHKEVLVLRKMSRPGVAVSLGAVGTADNLLRGSGSADLEEAAQTRAPCSATFLAPRLCADSGHAHLQPPGEGSGGRERNPSSLSTDGGRLVEQRRLLRKWSKHEVPRERFAAVH